MAASATRAQRGPAEAPPLRPARNLWNPLGAALWHPALLCSWLPHLMPASLGLHPPPHPCSGRFAPLIVVGLVAYSVGVTIYATSGKRQVAAAAAAAATQQAAPPQPPTRSPSGSSLASLSALADDEVEGLASALAAAAVAPERPPAEKREKREDRGEVCKVCGGSGQVRAGREVRAPACANACGSAHSGPHRLRRAAQLRWRLPLWARLQACWLRAMLRSLWAALAAAAR